MRHPTPTAFTFVTMAATDDAMAKVQAAIEAAQLAAANLAAAVGDLPEKAVAALPDQVAGVANTANDQATAAINVASDQLKSGAAALSAAAKAAADKAAAVVRQ
jgi:hypothetical protein